MLLSLILPTNTLFGIFQVEDEKLALDYHYNFLPLSYWDYWLSSLAKAYIIKLWCIGLEHNIFHLWYLVRFGPCQRLYPIECSCYNYSLWVHHTYYDGESSIQYRHMVGILKRLSCWHQHVHSRYVEQHSYRHIWCFVGSCRHKYLHQTEVRMGMNEPERINTNYL